jgi:hypothetical protein
MPHHRAPTMNRSALDHHGLLIHLCAHRAGRDAATCPLSCVSGQRTLKKALDLRRARVFSPSIDETEKQ